MLWVAEKFPSSTKENDRLSVKFFNLYQLFDAADTALGKLFPAKAPDESSFKISNWIFILENLTEFSSKDTEAGKAKLKNLAFP